VGFLKLQCFIADICLTIMIEMNLNFGFSLRPESDVRNNFCRPLTLTLGSLPAPPPPTRGAVFEVFGNFYNV